MSAQNLQKIAYTVTVVAQPPQTLKGSQGAILKIGGKTVFVCYKMHFPKTNFLYLC